MRNRACVHIKFDHICTIYAVYIYRESHAAVYRFCKSCTVKEISILYIRTYHTDDIKRYIFVHKPSFLMLATSVTSVTSVTSKATSVTNAMDHKIISC